MRKISISSQIILRIKTLLPIVLVVLMVMISCSSTYTGSLGVFDIDSRFYSNAKKHRANYDLFYAVKRSDTAGVREALKDRANPNVADSFGQSVLMWASWNGMPDIVQILITNKKSPNINQKSQNGYTALLCAAYAGRPDIFRMLVDKRADIRATDKNNETILHKAVKSGNVEMVKYILNNMDNGQYRTHINSQDRNGYTPLHYAVIAGDESIVKELLNEPNSADPYLPASMKVAGVDGKDVTKLIYPLSSALLNRRYSVYVDLLEKLTPTQADEILKTAEEFKAIQVRVDNFEEEKDKKDSEIKYVRSIRSRINNDGTPIKDEEFFSAINNFYKAIVDNNLAFARELSGFVREDIDKYGPDKARGNCLATAIRNKNLEMVEFLLDLDFKSTPDQDTLCIASNEALLLESKENFDILDMLISYLQRYRYEDAIRVNGIDRGTGDYALRYILRNEGYLLTKNWNQLQPLFQRFEGMLLNTNSRNDWIVSDIVRIGNNDATSEENKEKLVELKNKMFEYLCNRQIKRNPSYRINEISVLEFTLNEKYDHGANYLLLNVEDIERDAIYILSSRPDLSDIRGRIPERYETLRNKLEESIKRRDERKQTEIPK